MIRMCMAVLVSLLSSFAALPSVAQSGTEFVDIPLVIRDVPADAWSKSRIVPTLTNGVLTMRDTGEGAFDDASYWEVAFNTPLPFGRKQFVFDLEIGVGHVPMWGDSVFQPILNGEEAVPALTDDGTPTITLSISEDDGKGFLPVQSGEVVFQMPRAADAITSFAFMTAGAEGYDVSLSNFRVVVWPETDDRVWPQRPHASTLGYRADGPIVAFVEWHDDPQTLATERAALTLSGPDGDRTIEVILPKRTAAISASRVSRIDLGPLPVGAYTLQVPATGERTAATTVAFDVVPDAAALGAARDDAWDVFYWITEGPDGPYPDAHMQDTAAQVFGAPEMMQDVRGGWLDAGDYGKYAVNGAYSVSLMLLTGLVAPDALAHDIGQVANTPADVPDWLRVADAQLDWLYKMQREDGAVYHKATSQDWPSMSATPEDDLAVKWLMPVTTTATANFAAAMSLAAKIYADQTDPAYQSRAAAFEAAARRALAWLDANPDLVMIQSVYDGDQYGGPYDDHNDADERFFAVASYAALTGDMAAVAPLIAAQAATLSDEDYDTYWGSVGLLGMWALAGADNVPEDIAALVDEALRTASYRWRVAQTRSSWDVSISDDAQLAWGSNSVFATVGWHWLMWAAHSGEDRYVETAERQIHYLFGVNPLDQTYITGGYRNATAAPHFRPWSSGRIALPAGLIAGGPNSTNLAGDPLTGSIAGEAPMRMYVDDVESYATNEVAINWQSAWALSASLLVAALTD